MVRIYGASDDLVEIEGHPDGDEVGCYEQDVIVVLGDEKGGVLVRMSYSPRFTGAPGLPDAAFGCWSAEVAPIGEDVPMPWPVTITNPIEQRAGGPRGYSACVSVDCPADTKLAFVKVKP